MTTSTRATVLQVRSSAGLYGADRMVLMLNHSLARDGINSRLLSINNYRMREQALHEEAKTLGQPCALLPCKGRIDPRTINALANEVRSAPSAAVVHVHDYKSAFYAWLATRRRSAPLVATLHGWCEVSSALRFYSQLEMRLLHHFDALVVVAGQQTERLRKAGIPASRIYQIDNGIECDVSNCTASPELRDELLLPQDGFVFAAVARLSPEKNLAMLLDAFAGITASHPDATLLLIGDGSERDALEAQAQRLGLSAHVCFTGVRTDMHRIYPLIDCLVLPSLTEGMPLVALEAMAFAIPVVASAVGELPRLLASSPYSQLVAPGDVDALRNAMKFAASAPGRRDSAARQYVLDQHTAKTMADRYLDLYDALLRGSHARKAS